MAELLADRFVRRSDGATTDLATGLVVTFREHALDGSAARACDRAEMSTGAIDAGQINARTAFLAQAAPGQRALGGAGVDEDLEERLAGVLEVLDAGGGVRRCCVLSAVPARLDAAWLALAREARLRGIVPVSANEIGRTRELERVLGGRTIVLFVSPGAAGPETVAAVAGLVARGVRLHALLGIGHRWPGTPALDLDRPGRHASCAFREPPVAPDLALVADAPAPADASHGRAARWLMAMDDPRRAERAGRAALRRAVGVGDGPAALDALCLVGEARLERQEGVEAAPLVEAALALAGVWCPGQEVACRLSLARCRARAGRLEDVHALLSGAGDLGVAADCVRARAWLEQGRLVEGGTLVARLLRAGGQGHPVRAEVHHLAAWRHVAIGDLGGARRHVRAGLRACHASGAAAVEVSLRAVWLEGVVAFGERGQVGPAVLALRRARAAARSPAARERADRALALARTRGRSAAGLAREGTARDEPGLAAERGHRVTDDLLDLLMICHEAEDDGPALERLCAALRQRLSAAAVCVFGDDAAGRLVSVGQPRGPSPETARRAVATGQLVQAALVCDGWEAAAPVRYGGQTIGAVTCRWPVDASLDARRVDRLLATAAAACAPSLRAALERRATPPVTSADDLGLAGASQAMARVRQSILKAASVPFQVLIEGESGSGKELVARAVHRSGPRRQRRLCAINCAALPDELLEAELFGHTRGAFTGAVAERAGVFEEADGGTLFLDEVSELSPRAQAKLLRVLQESEVRRIGEGLPRRVDVRIVAATNKSLAREADGGRFRADLRYRLEVVRILVPPLRERREDIPLLAARFWADCSSRAGSRAVLDRTAIDALTRYDWPGNVRELQNVMAALAVHAPRRGRVVADDLPASVRGGTWLPACTLDEARRAFEVSFVREALRRAGGRRAAVARELGLTRQGLSKLLARLGLAGERGEDGDPAASGSAAGRRAGEGPAAGA